MARARFFIITVGLVCLFFTGCSYKTIKHGTEIADDQAARISDGSTTKQDIIMQFGEPTKTMDNERVFFYTWTRGSKGHVLGFGSGNAYSTTLAIVFDDTGVVQNHRVTRGATSGGAAVGD